MRIVLKSPPPVQDPPLPVRVELLGEMSGEDTARLAVEISENVSRELRFLCQVELVPKGTLETFQTDKNQKQQVLQKEYEA